MDATTTETLRDRFAMAALTGILSGCSGADANFPPEGKAARWAYEYADAMLRHREPARPEEAR